MIESSQSAGFKWTGNPFIDFGVAVLMEWCGLTDLDATPEQITVEMLKEFAAEAEDAYFVKPDLFKSVMLCFGSNFLNPSWNDQQKHENVRRLLLSALREPNPTLPLCPFFKVPAVEVVSRDVFPLLMGRGPINFYPGGQPGIAVSGQTLTAIQALMFGALRSQGKLMVVQADDRNLLRAIVGEWVQVVQRGIHLSKLDQEQTIAPPKSALVKTLVDIEQKRLRLGSDENRRYFGSVTLYHFSNSGQGPSIEVYPLPAPILTFISEAQTPEYYLAWNEIKRRYWPKPKAKKGQPSGAGEEPSPEQQGGLSNRFYNDLFGLPNNAKYFVRTYFFGTMGALVKSSGGLDGPRQVFKIAQITSLWQLTELFLQEVLTLRTERIEDIKELGTRLADIIMSNTPLYTRIYQTRRNWSDIRRLLRVISRQETALNRAPVVTLDQFLSIFEMGEDTEYADWALAWDLVVIKLMEELYKRDFFNKHPEVVDIDPEDEDAAALNPAELAS